MNLKKDLIIFNYEINTEIKWQMQKLVIIDQLIYMYYAGGWGSKLVREGRMERVNEGRREGKREGGWEGVN